ncbi:pyridine nucleotide-disulfide oxidoreductase [Streptomyces sp. CC53]|uniref:NAD(P)/FAD-dependent oxidoreductase n=1 Tax=unclassified Streptomyces TaxID=2593676 RepID=UPI0008DE0C90|nr:MULTISPECIES: FAD-dependent monooxygenase [unclassified Streptomyces]OII63750.1 pyridine nucleotide-disulfide oxidoreductase [Streptomyces sp. CC53]
MPRSAVVIGAGLAGMLAAAALAPVADTVTVLDRDTLPDEPRPRKGLPQGRHAHILLPGGARAVEALVPGVHGRLLAAGAHHISMTSGMVLFTSDGWLRRWRHDGHRLTTCSRDLIDHTVRAAVLARPGVTLRERTQAVRLLGTARRVTGVRVAPDGGPEEDLHADLVVDASGRGSRAVHWLAALGITGVPEDVVDSGLVNASRIYRVPDGAERFPLTTVHADPYGGRPGTCGTVVPIEGGRWMVSLCGTRGAEPPADPDGFLKYALDLRHPVVGRLVSGAEPLTDVALSRSTRNGRRRFEKSRLWPDGLVVLGDAVATFNPVYGQGMSVAALGAQALADEVRAAGPAAPGLARRVQRAAARWVEAAWALSTAQDIWFPDVRGKRPALADHLVTGYARRLTRAATGSYRVTADMADVTNLTAGATRLLRPSLLLAALAGPALPPLAGPPLTPAERAVLDRLDRTAPERSAVHR